MNESIADACGRGRRYPSVLVGVVQPVDHASQAGQPYPKREAFHERIDELRRIPALCLEYGLLSGTHPGGRHFGVGAVHQRSDVCDRMQPAQEPVPTAPGFRSKCTKVADLGSAEDAVAKFSGQLPMLRIGEQRQSDVRPEPHEPERRTALVWRPRRRAAGNDLDCQGDGYQLLVFEEAGFQNADLLAEGLRYVVGGEYAVERSGDVGDRALRGEARCLDR
ncbi:hypothetical protein OG558_23755 [Kribbella sp. NBC_01510]